MPLMLTPAMSEPVFDWFGYRLPPSLPRPLVLQVRRRIPARWRFILPEDSSRFSFLEPVGPRVFLVAPVLPVLSWVRPRFHPPIRTPYLGSFSTG